MLRGFTTVFLFALIFLCPSWTSAQDKKKMAVTELSQVDEDFAFQGEYEGSTYTSRYGHEQAGLQVVALGDGQFQAVQYRGGLPGAGWNRYDKFQLTGARENNTVKLSAQGFQIQVQSQTASLYNSVGQLVGRLVKTSRQSPTMGATPPPGATVLFDGSSTEHFSGGTITADGLLNIGSLTKQSYQDFQLHLEFRTPYMPYARCQGRGNSGIYVQRRYEVQVLDSFGLEGVKNECGGLYKTRAPDVNMALPPLSWQTYDIYFTAARWDSSGQKIANARFTVLHNAVVVHDDIEIANKTGAGRKESPQPGPILLQDHGNPIHYRNAWIIPGPSRPEPCPQPPYHFRRPLFSLIH